jgi:alpha-D-ribose 1-methylphosphonate 5-triphosphate synthase subunit PhnH
MMEATGTSVLTAGFNNPALDSQSAFRAAMAALSRPGTLVEIAASVRPPAPLSPELAALGLALLDFEVTFYLAPALADPNAVADYFRFHTGARQVADPAQASFAFLDLTRGDTLDPAAYAQGTAEYPDRSTTLLCKARKADPETGWRLSGPGIKGTTAFPLALPDAGFPARWLKNRASFPLGVDVLFTVESAVVGLPRSTRLIAEG